MSEKLTQKQFWNIESIVESFSGYPYLLLGETLALNDHYSEGMEGLRVLDLGCGGGRVGHFLKAMGAEVVGVDISKNMVLAASSANQEANFCLGDASSLPFKSGSFDLVVFAFNGLDYLAPKKMRMLAISEIHRLLSSRGKFIFSYHNTAALAFGWYRFMKPSKLLFRLKQVANGNFFKPETYMHDAETPDILTYFAWFNRVQKDVRSAGFDLTAVYPNSDLLNRMQIILRSNRITRIADPWPYLVFEKALSPLPSSRA